MTQEKVVLDEDDIRRTLVRIAHEIVEKNADGDVALVGIHRRGAHLATRLHRLVSDLLDVEIAHGDIDIAFYRDDLATRGADASPVVHSSDLPFRLEDHTVVLVDDVLYTGRTVRAAIDALFDYGRPARVQLAVLADRGHRELPAGEIDIAFYRDDLATREAPEVRSSHLPFRLEDHTVVLVDDVLFTGRTARAGIDALFDYGRPARVQLAVLADRGHRELPIRPDYVGKNLPTARAERVNVCVEEIDGRDEVTITTLQEAIA